MKKLTTVMMVLSLVLGGVALAVAADVPQTSKNLDLSAMQKISDQEAKQLRGTANFGSLTPGINCTNVCTDPLYKNSYFNDYNHLNGGPGNYAYKNGK
jgi:hypothetical protein